MKIRLLKNPGYQGVDSVNFPVEVDAEVENGKAYLTKSSLVDIGANGAAFSSLPQYCIPSHSWEAVE